MLLVVALVPATTKTAVLHDTISETSQGRHPRPAHQHRIATTSCNGETGMRGPEAADPRDEAFSSQDRPARAVPEWCTGVPTRLIDAGAETDLPKTRPLHSSNQNKSKPPLSSQRTHIPVVIP